MNHSAPIAILDLGTNTFHLLIAELNNHLEFKTIHKHQIPVKLGEKGINKGEIAPEAYKRGLKALKEFSKDFKRYNVENITAFATSAIREARNGKDFIEEVYNQFGIRIQTISGEEEAHFIFRGVQHSFPFPEENCLVMDIGGGSVEFIIGNRSGMRWKKSFKLGAARLIEYFHQSDPISDLEVESLKDHLRAELKVLYEEIHHYKPAILIGSAGSFESFIDLSRSIFNHELHRTGKAWELKVKDFNEVHDLLLRSTFEERRKMKGLLSFRVEMIVVAAIMVGVLIGDLKFKRIICSKYALKEGILLSLLEEGISK